jgi:hypothetical protein
MRAIDQSRRNETMFHRQHRQMRFPFASRAVVLGQAPGKALVVHRDHADLRMRALDPDGFSRYLETSAWERVCPQPVKRACGLAPTRRMNQIGPPRGGPMLKHKVLLCPETYSMQSFMRPSRSSTCFGGSREPSRGRWLALIRRAISLPPKIDFLWCMSSTIWGKITGNATPSIHPRLARPATSRP